MFCSLNAKKHLCLLIISPDRLLRSKKFCSKASLFVASHVVFILNIIFSLNISTSVITRVLQSDISLFCSCKQICPQTSADAIHDNVRRIFALLDLLISLCIFISATVQPFYIFLWYFF